MAASKYTKSVSGDFPSGVNEDRLTEEISDSSIVTAMDYIFKSGDICDIWFKDSLSTGDQTTLTSICSSHSGLPLLEKVVPSVRIQEETHDTGGYFQAEILAVNVPSGNAGDITTVDFSWPFPISALSSNLYPSAENVGDELVVCVAPDAVIGAIVQDIGIGSDTIYMSTTSLAYADLGQYIKLDDGTNADDMGVIVEKTSTYIKTSVVSTHAFVAATPTYIKRSAYMFAPGKFKFFKADIRMPVGESKIGGSYIPANTIFRCKYRNNGTAAKSFYAVFEYLY